MIFQPKPYKTDGNGMIYLKWWKGKSYNQASSSQQESKFDGEIKSFPHKQKLREFSTTKPVNAKLTSLGKKQEKEKPYLQKINPPKLWKW